MTYRQHFVFASTHGFRCILAGLYLCFHAVAPCFYRSAGSRLVKRLERDFTEHRIKTAKL